MTLDQLPTTCDRCRGSLGTFYGCSWFNLDTICERCQTDEEAHPSYQEARDAEHAAVVAGDFNFPGIGWNGDVRSEST